MTLLIKSLLKPCHASCGAMKHCITHPIVAKDLNSDLINRLSNEYTF